MEGHRNASSAFVVEAARWSGLSTLVIFFSSVLAVLILYGCSSDSASKSQDTSTPRPQPPKWLTFTPGTKALLTGEDPSDPVTYRAHVMVCEDSYTLNRNAMTNDSGGCSKQPVGQIVTIKSHGNGSDFVSIHTAAWSGVVDASSLSPIIPSGTILQCEGTESGTKLFSPLSPTSYTYDLRDGLETVKVLHTRRSNEVYGVDVKVVKGYGIGDIGYIRQSDFSKCFVRNTIQISFPDS